MAGQNLLVKLTKQRADLAGITGRTRADGTAGLALPFETVMTADPLGYSGTPLPRKLGITAGARVAALGAPPDFAGRLDGTRLHGRLRGSFDVIVLFADSAATLTRRLDAAVAALEPRGVLWIAWPKRASGFVTDVDERLVRESGLATGLVDNKVCAIDATWSGLRFAYRRERA